MKHFYSSFICIILAACCVSGFGIIANAEDYDVLPTDAFTIVNELNEYNNTGNAQASLNGTAISAPTYSVIIPLKVDFGEIKRTTESHIEKSPMTVSATGISNLFANQKKLVVTVESKNKYQLSDGTNNLSYNLYTAYTDETVNTPLSGATVLEMTGMADSDTSLAKTVDGAVTIDTKSIKKAGTYTDILTFTVALQEVD